MMVVFTITFVRHMAGLYPCTECKNECGEGTIQCNLCTRWLHVQCVPMSDVQLKSWSQPMLTFLCRKCCFVNGEFDLQKSLQSGETLYNRQKIMQGQEDIPLSDVGLKQAELVGQRLENESFTHVFTSDLSRANQTAQAIVSVNRSKTTDITKDKRLRERKLGIYEGKSCKVYIEAARSAKQQPIHSYTPPGGESLEQIKERAKSFFADLCQQLVAFVKEKDDIDYTPGSIKRRHGGSLGRHATQKYRQQVFSQRSQSFCGGCAVENNYISTNSVKNFVSDEKRRRHEADRSSLTDSNNSILSSTESVEASVNYNNDFKPFLSSDSNSSGYGSQTDNSNQDLESNGIPTTNFMFSSTGHETVPYGCCPNVSVSPLKNHRLPSISSISSGRNSSFDDVDSFPPSLADVLVVSHGGLIKELLLHLVDDLDCKVPGGRNLVTRIGPNCSISKFTVYIHDASEKPVLTCNVLYAKDHLYENETFQTEYTI